MTDREINDFVINHSGADWFDIDLKLYREKFPQSKILKDLENAPDFRKAQLDERMVAELLRDGGQCVECILNNRGFMIDKDGFIVPMQKEGELNEFEKQLLQIDLDGKPNYNTLKAIVFGLGLITTDNSGKTYIDALKEIKAKLPVPDPNASKNVDPNAGKDLDPSAYKDVDPNAGNDLDPSAGNDIDPNASKDVDHNASNDIDLEKKSEDPEPSTLE